MTFSKRLKETRKKRGLTLSELGNKINKTEATIQRYESGNIKNLKNDTIEQLATALNVSPSYLMGWEEKEEYQPTTIAAHLDGEVSDLDEDEMQKVLEYVKFLKSQQGK
ncbi:XRE family transcriptional regulator [Mammaliicoccus sciuri]|uniref:helix-turn-helix domain-containing protein n=1 Tax=Mammaliicoccus sciuri TaxID=1296 RepID=UPI0010729F84|nr:helix-turn-helix transcriptional regulator [Mammaliicoccus sciuri]MBF0773240.1 helix-turn-helix transcriptional regulator [Mammaliicoccus sciuri]TFU88262.1 XRE family transcriptional regulator [Mammaliicoccus sciuri]